MIRRLEYLVLRLILFIMPVLVRLWGIRPEEKGTDLLAQWIEEEASDE